jgi:DNA-binding response OmpR family regulator
MHAENRLAGTRVLVVEDEFLIADDLARALRQCGAELIGPAGTLADADRLIRSSEPPDAAILDLNLHGEDSAGLVEQLSERGIPCLILSGYSERSFPDRIRGLPKLEKPVPYDRVTRTLADIIESRVNVAS